MKTYPLLGVLALVLLVQTPFILAFDCNTLDPVNKDTCRDIMNSELTDLEKELLVSNLEYSNKFFPDHDFIYQRNTNLNIDDAPEGVQEYNGNFVKNAWMKIFASMPSILYNGTILVPEHAQIMTGYNSEVRIPSNYYNSRKRDGDICRINYNVRRNTATNKIYVNGVYQGSGDLVNANINSDSEIKSIYDINVEVDVDYYKWDKYCSRRRNGRCVSYKYRCEYRYDQTKKDNIRIVDTLNVKKYDNDLFGDLQIINSYGTSTKLKPTYSDSIEIEFEYSDYKFNKHIYSINYSLAPYYVYTLKAEDYNQETTNNLFKEGVNLVVKNINTCKLKAFDFFNIFEKTCDSQYEDVDFYIKTDKLKYKPGEEIKVEVFPKDIQVQLIYGEIKKEVKGGESFYANASYNKVTAYYNNLNTQKVIFIQDEERFETIFDLSIFGFLNVFLYSVVKRYWGGLI